MRLKEHLHEIRWRVRITQTNPAQNADILHDLGIRSSQRRRAQRPKARDLRIVRDEQDFGQVVVLRADHDIVGHKTHLGEDVSSSSSLLVDRGERSGFAGVPLRSAVYQQVVR